MLMRLIVYDLGNQIVVVDVAVNDGDDVVNVVVVVDDNDVVLFLSKLQCVSFIMNFMIDICFFVVDFAVDLLIQPVTHWI